MAFLKTSRIDCSYGLVHVALNPNTFKPNPVAHRRINSLDEDENGTYQIVNDGDLVITYLWETNDAVITASKYHPELEAELDKATISELKAKELELCTTVNPLLANPWIEKWFKIIPDVAMSEEKESVKHYQTCDYLPLDIFPYFNDIAITKHLKVFKPFITKYGLVVKMESFFYMLNPNYKYTEFNFSGFDLKPRTLTSEDQFTKVTPITVVGHDCEEFTEYYGSHGNNTIAKKLVTKPRIFSDQTGKVIDPGTPGVEGFKGYPYLIEIQYRKFKDGTKLATALSIYDVSWFRANTIDLSVLKLNK